MNRTEFLKALSSLLTRLKRKERESTLAYYEESINDRVESGMSEEEAVADLGDVNEIAKQAIADAKERGKLRSDNKALYLTLIIIGSPLWLSLLIAALSTLLALCCTVWSVPFSLWAADVGLVLFGIAGVIRGCVTLFSNTAYAIGIIGSGFLAIAVSLLLFVPLLMLTRWMISAFSKLFTKGINGIKSLFERNN